MKKSFFLLRRLLFTLIFISINVFAQDSKPVLSITIDDPSVEPLIILDWPARDDAILNTLDKHLIKAALFVCGKRIDNSEGHKLLKSWDSRGHMICNHSFSHSYFHSSKISLQDYENDFLRCDSIIRGFTNYTKLFRFPFLKEGNTIEKRDGFRSFLTTQGYKNGYVTIDASDWYIDGRMRDTLKYNTEHDITAYREYYLNHIYDRAVFYDSLAQKITGRHIKHTLLLHHNLTTALFLDTLLSMFKSKGWEIVSAGDAFSDEIFNSMPDVFPAGESLIWAIAKESGKYESLLRYPGEDGEYEEENFNKFISSYGKK